MVLLECDTEEPAFWNNFVICRFHSRSFLKIREKDLLWKANGFASWCTCFAIIYSLLLHTDGNCYNAERERERERESSREKEERERG